VLQLSELLGSGVLLDIGPKLFVSEVVSQVLDTLYQLFFSDKTVSVVFNFLF
jgi:hypothetical protein